MTAPKTEGLTEAWAEAEAALPEGGRLACQRRPENGPYEAWAQSADRRSLGFAYADTPTLALRALAARLAENPEARP